MIVVENNVKLPSKKEEIYAIHPDMIRKYLNSFEIVLTIGKL